MIRVGSVIFTFCLLTLVSHAQTFYGTTDLKTFRDGRDKEFGDKQQSPLKEEDFDSFKGLNYFPVDNRFRVTAKFMPMSGDEFAAYVGRQVAADAALVQSIGLRPQ